MNELTFEQGPIRPPSEAGSLLLRFTRNCPWNKCAFCPVYKNATFSRRSLDEIKKDIDAAAAIVEDLRSRSERLGHGGKMTREVLGILFSGRRHSEQARHVAVWLHFGRGSVFIQDANSLVLPTPMLSEAIRYLKEKIPGVGRITSYARSSTLAKKSVSELAELRQAGLDRIHIGMESGSDRVLALVKKGVTAKQQIEAGRKVIEAGMELSEYIMPGLGGTALSRDHATESARVLNAIGPHFIRLRSLRVPSRAPLYREMKAGRFIPASDDDTVREIRLFISLLEGIESRLISDHIMNLLEEVEGKLPEDRDAMLAVIDRYLALPDSERLLFRVGRRGGGLRSLDDMNGPGMRERLEAAIRHLESETGGDVETIIKEMADQYI